MPDLDAKRDAWLSRRRRQSLSREVTLVAAEGGRAEGVLASIAETRVDVVDATTGVVVESVSRDFIIARADYAFGGNVREPAEGDLILDRTSGEERTYEVRKIPGRESWRWADAHANDLRVHTKEVAG